LISPSDQAALAYKSNLILSWKGVPGAVEYSVQVFGTEAIDSGWISGTSFTLKDLQPGTYSWKVKARNIEGLETGWSEVWSFNVILNPGTPQLITPVDNSQLGDSIVSLSWKADAATEYLAELYTGSDVVGAPYKTLYWSKERTWNITGLPLGTYTWRVKARNGMCQ